eukprot:m.222633 g.222633  ORF g.222633 m.222633 type:complete len:855 (-) comp16071_c1_seq1:21-2585(-)
MRRIFLLVALACALAVPEQYFRVFEEMTCGNILKEVEVPSSLRVEPFCSAQCLLNVDCGGYTWMVSATQSRCALVSHQGVASECQSKFDARTAIRDTRRGFATFAASTEQATMNLRCPELTLISGVTLASVGSTQRHSPSVEREVLNTCAKKQSCVVTFDSAAFLQSFLNECDDMSQCESVHVAVQCEASPNFNEDTYFTSWSAKSWPSARAQAQTRRREWQEHLDHAPAYPNNATGKGVIVVAGGKYIEPALVLAMRLREVGFTHTIQFWHLGGNEIPPESVPLLTKLQVETCDFYDYVPIKQLAFIPANVGLRRFQLKPLALLHTSLREVLMLDADNSPIRDPSYLFDCPEYRRTGAVFWPDYWTTNTANPIWDLVDEAPATDWEQESGQLLVDKARSWRALQLCVYMNSEFYMRLLNGDKDTFRFSWKATNTPYHMVSVWPATLGIGLGSFGNQTHLCGHTMLQHDPAGLPLFVHHNQMKELVLPVGHNFKFLQRRDQPCRAAPRAGLVHDHNTIPCFDFVSPRMPYVEPHLLPVTRAHLEIFELRYAMARRTVLRQLGWGSSGSKRRGRRSLLSSGLLTTTSNSNNFNDNNNTTTNQTFTIEGNLTELVTICSSTNETTAPTNTTDRLCEPLSVSPQVWNITYVAPTVDHAAGLAVRVSDDSQPLFRGNVSMVVGFTYQIFASVSQQIKVILTHRRGGGPTAPAIPEAPNALFSPSAFLLQPTLALTTNNSLFYESPIQTDLGGEISVGAGEFAPLPNGVRVSTAFDPSALLFTLSGDINNAADLAGDCQHRCASDETYAKDCVGYFLLSLSTSVTCKGLTHVGEPTPTRLGSLAQSWIKLPRIAPEGSP